MYESLERAKECGAISFDWTETCVIVTAVAHVISTPELQGVMLAETKEGDEYRRELEHHIADMLGILVKPWIPPYLSSN